MKFCLLAMLMIKSTVQAYGQAEIHLDTVEKSQDFLSYYVSNLQVVDSLLVQIEAHILRLNELNENASLYPQEKKEIEAALESFPNSTLVPVPMRSRPPILLKTPTDSLGPA